MSALLLLACSGCAFTTGHVNVAYEPSTAATKVASAESPHVIVAVTDKRPTRVVGQKINGYGMKTADIVSDNDVPATVKDAFQTELSNRGFVPGPGGNIVEVELDNLHNQFTLGLVSGDSTANLGMTVSVKRSDGTVAYSKYITGQGKEWIEIAREGNAEHVLSLALQDAISKVFTDPGFIDALKK